MLVLSRRLNQALIIAKDVKITVVRITPHRVELGVEAERDIPVDREEIHLRKQAAGDTLPIKGSMDVNVAESHAEENRAK